MIKKAVIPIGGDATRLRPLTIETSKGLVRLLNKPILEHSILSLAKDGIEEVYLGVRGYVNYTTLFDYFREGYWLQKKYGLEKEIRIRYMPRYESTTNGDAVWYTMEYYGIKEPVVVIQGDNIYQLNIQDMYKWHRKKNAFMTIALQPVEDVTGFGVAKIDDDYRIEYFVEKPRPEQAPSNLANTGIYILSENFWEFLNEGWAKEMKETRRLDFGGDIIPALIEHGYEVYGYPMEGYWFDVGTPERYLNAAMYLLRHLSPEDMEAVEITHDVYMQGKSEMSEDLRRKFREMIKTGKLIVEGKVLLGRHISIGKGTALEDAVIDNYTIVGRNCEILHSVVMDRVKLGDNVRIVNSIIGRHVEIGNNVRIVNSVIGDNAVIEDNVRMYNVKIWPHEFVERGATLEHYTVRTGVPRR
ncbi:sugar-phosphate nucleotidyltransferase [Thermococcus kodakarensis KOD1]|uniref:Bifunctional protein GlmU n=1 Tax=Thermococcus kodakarensis (strain ATCC BAA-918 / JCM 12380 / KOD1) TaxID=69014 RepID=Q5JFQ9_THEKO|nr:NDP-sugar synthase [Thermococcus kodakarensis]WCN28309.1 NDP-sugar synthase [Thermococcus kodakarensis]WCN30604.1 NDP-sugar synthase [Thermococcus kodakarensis]BAD84408.1 sugar-phosphate nucleotidyltransferase [Thermococcus kodakarensis KOD1]